jgi:hypothetical protein
MRALKQSVTIAASALLWTAACGPSSSAGPPPCQSLAAGVSATVVGTPVVGHGVGQHGGASIKSCNVTVHPGAQRSQQGYAIILCDSGYPNDAVSLYVPLPELRDVTVGSHASQATAYAKLTVDVSCDGDVVLPMTLEVTQRVGGASSSNPDAVTPDYLLQATLHMIVGAVKVGDDSSCNLGAVKLDASFTMDASAFGKNPACP